MSEIASKNNSILVELSVRVNCQVYRVHATFDINQSNFSGKTRSNCSSHLVICQLWHQHVAHIHPISRRTQSSIAETGTTTKATVMRITTTDLCAPSQIISQCVFFLYLSVESQTTGYRWLCPYT